MSEAILGGIRVVDLSNTRTGAQISQVMADYGAEVIHIEPRGGSPLRQQFAWPMWGRGKRAIQLDLKQADDLSVARSLCEQADVVIETFRPGVADRLGLGYEALAAVNPRLVYASINGFGSKGPWANVQGYEGAIFAKFGFLWCMSDLVGGQRPAILVTSYAAYVASMLGLQGILAALIEREDSGRGQHVEASLAQAMTVYDTSYWFTRLVALRFGDGFTESRRIVDGIPAGGMSFRLLVALTKDGRWLQFSQTVDKLFRSMIELFGLAWMFDDPKWAGIPNIDDPAKRVEFWEMLLTVVHSKTLAEWRELFDQNRNVWGELFTQDAELLSHPQMLYNKMLAEIQDPDLGQVRMLGPIARFSDTPAQIGTPAPRLGEHDAAIRAEALQAGPAAAAAPGEASTAAPLAGVTIVEIGTYYAGPYGLSMLADLGARVIKLEQPDGDPFRYMFPVPDVAAIKCLQGKECVAVDLGSEEGRKIAHRIVAGADVVLQSFRAGAAERLKLDDATLRGINPDLVYLSAPGYGEGGPCGGRPAFAPTIGAAAGVGARNLGSAITERDDITLEEIKRRSLILGTADVSGGNPDGLSAATASVAILLGLYAKKRGIAGGQHALTTMLSSTGHALSDIMLEYEGGPEILNPDAELMGMGPLYQLYRAQDDWVFLAAPGARDWKRLVAAMAELGCNLGDDPRFATTEDRKANAAQLAHALSDVFATRTAAEWESLLLAKDVTCVVCGQMPCEQHYMDEGSPGVEQGYVTCTIHPVLDEVPRLRSLVSFSRSATLAGPGGIIGQHTRQVLEDFGYDEQEIGRLAESGAVYCA